MVITLKFVDEPYCVTISDHLNESYRAVHSCGTVHYVVQGGSNFEVCRNKSSFATIKTKAIELYVYVHSMLYRENLTLSL